MLARKSQYRGATRPKERLRWPSLAFNAPSRWNAGDGVSHSRSVALPRLGRNGAVRNQFLSVDPYARADERLKSYVPPFALDPRWTAELSVMWSKATIPPFAVGDPRVHMRGGATKPWCRHRAQQIARPRRRAATFLCQPRADRRDAYFGLPTRAAGQPGDIVFVSAAAGRGRSAVVQIAKAKGMDCDRIGRRRRECEFVKSPRRRRSDRLQGRVASQAARRRRRAEGDRRLFRQFRRRPSRRRARAGAAQPALPLRMIGRLQHRRTATALYHAHHRDAHPAPGVHLHDYLGRLGASTAILAASSPAAVKPRTQWSKGSKRPPKPFSLSARQHRKMLVSCNAYASR